MSESRTRWWALGALAIAMLTIGLDTTVLNVAVPTLADDLHASTGQLQWFSTAYTLVLAGMLLPAGMLGDRFGRKRLLVGALVLFGAASAACAYADSAGQLIAARAVLGLGAALMMPLSMAVLPVLFPDRDERARALTIWVTSTAVGLPLGPIVGGWLLDTFWWGSVFLINVPLVVVGVIAVSALVPESRSSTPRSLDLVGVVLSSAGLLGLTYGFIAAGQDGWTDSATLGSMVGGLALLVGFVAWQRRVAHPLIDLDLFRDRGFTWGTLLSTVVNFALFGLIFAMPQFFQAVQGTDALGSGLRLLPVIGGMLVGTRLADRLVAKIGASAVIAVGFALLAGGLGAGATTGVHTSFGVTAIWFTLLGVGLGLAMPTAMSAAVGTLSAERSGSGSALIQALRQVGGTIGVAVLGTLLSSGYHARLDTGDAPAAAAGTVRESVSAGVATAERLGLQPLLDSVRGAFVHGLDVMLVASAGLAALGIVLAVLLLPRRAPRVAAEAEAESLHELVS
jgi:MFS transporter, DHA2 family, multidrug resistance protein